jgi:hypothetical protein
MLNKLMQEKSYNFRLGMAYIVVMKKVYLEWGFVIIVNDLLLGIHAEIIQNLSRNVIADISNSIS